MEEESNKSCVSDTLTCQHGRQAIKCTSHKSSAKSRRPDQQVYVPRARRVDAQCSNETVRDVIASNNGDNVFSSVSAADTKSPSAAAAAAATTVSKESKKKKSNSKKKSSSSSKTVEKQDVNVNMFWDDIRTESVECVVSENNLNDVHSMCTQNQHQQCDTQNYCNSQCDIDSIRLNCESSDVRGSLQQFENSNSAGTVTQLDSTEIYSEHCIPAANESCSVDTDNLTVVNSDTECSGLQQASLLTEPNNVEHNLTNTVGVFSTLTIASCDNSLCQDLNASCSVSANVHHVANQCLLTIDSASEHNRTEREETGIESNCLPQVDEETECCESDEVDVVRMCTVTEAEQLSSADLSLLSAKFTGSPTDTFCTDSLTDIVSSKHCDDNVAAVAAVDNVDDDDDNWEQLFDETGDELVTKLPQQNCLTVSADNKLNNRPIIDYYVFEHRDPDVSSDVFYWRENEVLFYVEYGHLVEIYDFPADLQTRDLVAAFIEFKDRGFEIKWVDDTHAIGVFSSSLAAKSALTHFHNPLIKVQSIHTASRQTKLKAKRAAEFLQPYKPRPETVASVARNLVAGALGLKTRVTKEQKEEERRKLKQARDRKRETVKLKNDAWDGAITQ